jgi:hypothetical protein
VALGGSHPRGYNERPAGRVIALRWRLTKVFRDWVECVRQYGPHAVAAYPFDLIRVRRSEQAEGFDARFDTDTATVVHPWNLLSLEGKRYAEIHAYEAAPAWLIREILDSIPLRPHEFAFVDLGSGKGRALLVASELPFARIVGVELAPELHRIAEENIKRYRTASQQCAAFFLHCMNALEYSFGPEPLVLFLFNPFGRDSVRRILANLEASLRATPREAFVIYVNPRFGALAQNAPFLRRVKKGGAWWRPWSRYTIYAAPPDKAGRVGQRGRTRRRHRGMAYNILRMLRAVGIRQPRGTQRKRR